MYFIWYATEATRANASWIRFFMLRASLLKVGERLHGGKVLQHRQPDVLALLRMELRRLDVLVPEHRGERIRIVRGCRDDGRFARDTVVGMHEVDRRAVGDVAQDRRGA